MVIIVKQDVIDLFCGAGGFSEGFRQAGYHVLAANDFDKVAGMTYEATHRDTRFLPGPIQEIEASDFLDAAGLEKGELFCLVGGPPCQAYSIYNHQRGLHDRRSQLFHEYLRIVEGVLPQWVVMENVPGILSAGSGAAVRQILAGLKSLGYNVEYRILHTEDFGVPQERRRLIFIGNRIGVPIAFPEKTHGNREGLFPLVTIRDAIGDLPSLENGEDHGVMDYATEARSDFQRSMRGCSTDVQNHAAPRLRSINIERMTHIPPCGSWRDIPFDLLPNGMKRARRSDHTKRYGRMTWEGQSCTILTKCDLHWGAYIHPDQDRSISVREAARIQTFPDWFHFKGTKTGQYAQVGNAVPPLLGRCIGEAIVKAMIQAS